MATEYQQLQQSDEPHGTLKRRGLIAGAAALVVGVLAKQTAQPVGAATFPNIVVNNSPASGASIGIDATNGYGTPLFTVGVAGNGANTGVSGVSYSSSDTTSAGGFFQGNQNGVRAMVNGLTGPASWPFASVAGWAGGGSDAIGVWGVSDGSYGVYGSSNSSFGVYGNTNAPINSHLPGIYGIGNGTGTYGVIGDGFGGNGVWGVGGTGYGVYGTSTHSFGGWFESGSDQGSGGVVGVARSAGTIGFQALAVSPATYAGFFRGTVSVIGSLGVTGSKFAVVKGQDGKYRGMYAMESPECWFEDFGTGTVVNGTAAIKLDPLFAQHVRASEDYHVFITEHDQNNNLHVTGRTATGFAVQPDEAAVKAKGKTAAAVNGTFSYRVVAKRNDIKGERLPVWEMPQEPHIPDPPKASPPAQKPVQPASPSRP